MYLIENYPLSKSRLDKYIILQPSDLQQIVDEHKKMLDPNIGRLRYVSPGFYTLMTVENTNYFLDVYPTLYNYISNLDTNTLIADNLYKVSIDTEKTLYASMDSLIQYQSNKRLREYLADIDQYMIDTTLYDLYRNILKYRLGDPSMDDQSIIDVYNALQEQLATLETATTAEILIKLQEISAQVNNLSTYLSSLRPESNMYKLTSGLIESFNHLVDVCTANTQQAQ